MTPELAELLRCYRVWQECPPLEQADHRDTFERAVTAAALAHQIERRQVMAYVMLQWELQCQQDDRRKGAGKRPKTEP